MKKYSSISVVVRVIAIILLFVATFDKYPYGFYKVLRWVVCAAAAYSAYVAYETNKRVWIWLLGVIALLFNPLIKFHLSRDVWQPIDLLTGILILISLFFVREKNS